MIQKLNLNLVLLNFTHLKLEFYLLKDKSTVLLVTMNYEHYSFMKWKKNSIHAIYKRTISVNLGDLCCSGHFYKLWYCWTVLHNNLKPQSCCFLQNREAGHISVNTLSAVLFLPTLTPLCWSASLLSAFLRHQQPCHLTSPSSETLLCINLLTHC